MAAQLLDRSFLQYDTPVVPEPRKKKPIIVGKLVNKVKRLKRTTSKVAHYNANQDPGSNELQSKLEQVQHGSRLLGKIKSHILTSDDEQQTLQPHLAAKSRRYFKKRNTANHIESKQSSLSRKHDNNNKCQRQQYQNEKDTHPSLLSIKQQLSQFKVPADWNCIKENKMGGLEYLLPSQMIRDVIQNINMHRLAIGTVLERIELKQCEIKQLSERITELNLKLEQLVVKPDGNKKMMVPVNQLKKNRPLLKQAYIRHKRIRRTIDANKSILDSTWRLERLHAKVNAFSNNASFWSMIYWLFPLVAMVVVLKFVCMLL